MASKTIYRFIRADWIIESSDRVHQDAVLVWEQDRVEALLDGPQFVEDHPTADVYHPRNAILTPGFINAHTHLELSFLSPPDSVPPFFDWVSDLNRQRQQIHPDEQVDRNQEVIRDTISAGTIAFGDITNNGRMIEWLLESGVPSRSFIEVLGFTPGRADQIWDDVHQKFAPYLNEATVQLTAHSPYGTSPELMHRIFDHYPLASVHVDELPHERAFLMDGGGPIRDFLDRIGVWSDDWKPPALTPYAYLDRCASGSPLRLVHCLHANATDLSVLRNHRIILCPRSNQILHKRLPPVDLFAEAQLPFALGTDSMASCPDLSILSEMRFLYAHSDISAHHIFRAGTETGAEMLGLTGFGTLAPGSRGGCNLFQLPVLSADPIRQLLSGEPLEQRLINHD